VDEFGMPVITAFDDPAAQQSRDAQTDATLTSATWSSRSTPK
jgi:hypothetical protein